MGIDQKGNVELRVSPGENNMWDVNESGFDRPLASFESEQDARKYADDIAGTKQGSRVIVDGGASR